MREPQPDSPADDHPLCGRCGYDLSGLPLGTAACPECGAGLREPHALTTAARLRRRARAKVAIGCGLLVAAFACVHVARGVDWQRVKPVWMLVREGHDADTHRAALAELIRRLDEGRLSGAQAGRVADEALAAQADPARPWLETWGDFVERARALGKLSDERWTRYAGQALAAAVPPTALTVPPRSARGAKELPVTVTYKPTRTGAARFKPLWVQTTVRATGGDPLGAKQYGSEVEHPLQIAGGDVPQPYRVALDPAKLAAAGDGPHVVSVSVEAVVSETADFSLNRERFPGRFEPVLTRRYEFKGTFSLSPTTAPSR